MLGSSLDWITKIRQEDLTHLKWNGYGDHSSIMKENVLRSLPTLFISITVLLEVLILTQRVKMIPLLTILICKGTMSIKRFKNFVTGLIISKLTTRLLRPVIFSWFSGMILDGAMPTSTSNHSTNWSIISTKPTLMSSCNTQHLPSISMRYQPKTLPGLQSMMTCSLMLILQRASGLDISLQERMPRAM